MYVSVHAGYAPLLMSDLVGTHIKPLFFPLLDLLILSHRRSNRFSEIHPGAALLSPSPPPPGHLRPGLWHQHLEDPGGSSSTCSPFVSHGSTFLSSNAPHSLFPSQQALQSATTLPMCLYSLSSSPPQNPSFKRAVASLHCFEFTHVPPWCLACSRCHMDEGVDRGGPCGKRPRKGHFRNMQTDCFTFTANTYLTPCSVVLGVLPLLTPIPKHDPSPALGITFRGVLHYC